jgi:nucleotide-binding universal stress UspA family protein
MTLHVVRVLPAARGRAEGFAGNPLAAPTREAARRLRACRETRAWCDQVLPHPLPALRVAVRAGEFVSEISQRAHELQAELISMAPLRGRSGSIVAALARSAAVPVLVTRGQTPARSFLAASDLEDETYPILRRTAALAREIAADVLLFHDLGTMPESKPGKVPDSAPASSDRQLELQRQRLLCAARRWSPGGRVVVTVENDPARAIVTQAAHSDVDTIVVGTRPHAWLARRLAQTVAARVVEAADRSVLVVPIEGRTAVA